MGFEQISEVDTKVDTTDEKMSYSNRKERIMVGFDSRYPLFFYFLDITRKSRYFNRFSRSSIDFKIIKLTYKTAFCSHE